MMDMVRHVPVVAGHGVAGVDLRWMRHGGGAGARGIGWSRQGLGGY